MTNTDEIILGIFALGWVVCFILMLIFFSIGSGTGGWICFAGLIICSIGCGVAGSMMNARIETEAKELKKDMQARSAEESTSYTINQ